MGLALYGLTLVWFHRDGHRSVSFPDRPWYPGKEEPSYADILAALAAGELARSIRGCGLGAGWSKKPRLRSLSSSSAAPPDRRPAAEIAARERVEEP